MEKSMFKFPEGATTVTLYEPQTVTIVGKSVLLQLVLLSAINSVGTSSTSSTPLYTALIAVVLVAVAIVGSAVYYFKFRK